MSDKNKTYCLINYGCQMNESDTEHYAGQMQELGYAPNPDFHTADIIIVNTCCVRESAEKKIAGKIGELKAVKRANPDVVICVAGCMAQKDGEKLRKKHPQVDLLLGTAYVNDFKRLLLEFLAERKAAVYTDLTIHQSEFEGHMVRQSSFAAWIPIMYGCNNFCTYCIVPYTRGRERSRMPESIVEEIRGLAADGVKEITLLGQNVNSYGNESDFDCDFAGLIYRINEVEGIERIRFMTSHPKDLSDRLIQAFVDCEKLCRHIHLPVQSGSTEILRRMNRRYTKEDYLQLVEKIRASVPDIAITTDIIVGFPGETEEDFEETMDLVRRVRYDSAFTFLYSVRTGTPAAEYGDQVPEDIKHVRFERLVDALNEITAQKNALYQDRVEKVLVEGVSKSDGSTCSGRTDTFKLVNFSCGEEKIGQIVDVRITEAKTFSLFGELV